MTRPMRTLVIVAAIGLAGVVALAWMAQRYKAMQPTKSVYDAPEASVPAPDPIPPASAPPVDAVPAGTSPAETEAASDPTAAVDAKAAGEVDDFITVRRILHGMTLAHPKAVSQLVEQMAKGVDPKAKAVPLNLQFLMAYRSRRHAALEKVALAPERYVAVREAYLAWRASQPVADAALGRALEARRQHLEAADLGPAEPLDTLLEL